MESQTLGDFPSDGEDLAFTLLQSPPLAESVADLIIDQSFRVNRKSYTQFNTLYNARLQKQSTLVIDMLTETKLSLPVVKIGDLVASVPVDLKSEESLSKERRLFSVMGEKMDAGGKIQMLQKAHKGSVVIIGTILRDHGVEDASKEIQYGSLMESKTQIKEGLVLEDGTSKTTLTFTSAMKGSSMGLVNGMVCGMAGNLVGSGTFLVNDIILPEPRVNITDRPEFNYKLALIAGLQQGVISEDKLNTLVNHLQCCAKDTTAPCKFIVIFVGNSFNLSHLSTAEKNNAISKLDEKLAQLSEIAQVIIIPGLKDPCPPMLPQQPLHRVFFSKARKMTSFHSETNPCRILLNAINQRQPLEMLIASGETVKDFCTAVNIQDESFAAQVMLRSGHLCPTAPNTTAITPGLDEDVFVLEKAPNFFIFGSQGKTTTISRSGRTHVVSLPGFAEQGTLVIFDKNTTPIFCNFK